MSCHYIHPIGALDLSREFSEFKQNIEKIFNMDYPHNRFSSQPIAHSEEQNFAIRGFPGVS